MLIFIIFLLHEFSTGNIFLQQFEDRYIQNLFLGQFQMQGNGGSAALEGGHQQVDMWVDANQGRNQMGESLPWELFFIRTPVKWLAPWKSIE